MRIKLSVIICTFNRAARLNKCLNSLTKQTFSAFEVIIIDGGSSDNSNIVINKYKKLLKVRKFIFSEKELARARDLGWRKARGKYIAWIDDDVTVTPQWAGEIAATLDKNPKVGGVSGPTIIPVKFLNNRDVFSFYHKSGAWVIVGKIWEKFFLEGKKYEVGKILKSGAWTPGSNFKASLKIKGLKDVDYLEACNMALRKNLVITVNGFDFKYGGVGEWSEIDLAARIKNLGFRLVFNPKAIVHHYISQSGVYKRRTFAKQRMENFLKFYFRHVFKFRYDYILKFFSYLLFLNSYWTYKAITTGNINWASGWIGTATGMAKVIWKGNWE